LQTKGFRRKAETPFSCLDATGTPPEKSEVPAEIKLIPYEHPADHPHEHPPEEDIPTTPFSWYANNSACPMKWPRRFVEYETSHKDMTYGRHGDRHFLRVVYAIMVKLWPHLRWRVKLVPSCFLWVSPRSRCGAYFIKFTYKVWKR